MQFHTHSYVHLYELDKVILDQAGTNENYMLKLKSIHIIKSDVCKIVIAKGLLNV